MSHLPREMNNRTEPVEESIREDRCWFRQIFATLAGRAPAVKQGLEPDAGCLVPGLDLAQLRDDPAAIVHRDGTPRMENAPGWRVQRARHLPAQDHVLAPGLHRRVRDGH